MLQHVPINFSTGKTWIDTASNHISFWKTSIHCCHLHQFLGFGDALTLWIPCFASLRDRSKGFPIATTCLDIFRTVLKPFSCQAAPNSRAHSKKRLEHIVNLFWHYETIKLRLNLKLRRLQLNLVRQSDTVLKEEGWKLFINACFVCVSSAGKGVVDWP